MVDVADRVGVARSTLHRWIGRYLVESVAGLADRSHRPASCPHQVATMVEVVVAEMRRKHPRWGSKRIRMELLRKPVVGVVVPSERTIARILLRQGLALPRPRKRARESYVRWEQPGPMQLWGIDIVGGIWIVNPSTGELREAKVVTGVDDHSRFAVMAAVVERATGRAVCLAFALALARCGVPEEVLTDNGKQFTDRFGKGGEVLFDKTCRKERDHAPAHGADVAEPERGVPGRRRHNHFDCGRTFGATRVGWDGLVDVFASYNMTVMTLGLWHPDPHRPKSVRPRVNSRWW